ncbi:MAG: succinate dehydrogenase cytochrome b subunit [Candidatus Sericytochromatia bacterium]|nr:succinate dehydrogenase cytochrome b subunit [Candidatus Sericytochromatia bacterium]
MAARNAFLSANPLAAYYGTTIGKKTVVAVTGFILIGFLFIHLAGNLLMFQGPEAINTYAEWLEHLGHGAAKWVVRGVLLASVVLHVATTARLTRENRAARPQKYAVAAPQRSTVASRSMILSGLTLLSFIIYHLLHYTVRTVHAAAAAAHEAPLGTPVGGEAFAGENVYNMVVAGFGHPGVSFFYLLSMFLLCLHLSHGFQSAFQTLGLSNARMKPTWGKVGIAVSWLLFVGFASIPVAVLTGHLKAH